MLKRTLNGVRSACGKSWDFTVGVLLSESRVFMNPMTYVIGGLFALGLLVGAGDVLAQGSVQSVDFDEIVSFGSVFDTIRTTIAPLVAAALGLGLAIWGARYIFRIIKSAGR